MTATATQGTCNTSVVRDASTARARTAKERTHTAPGTTARTSLFELSQLVRDSFVTLRELVEALLRVLQERLEGGDVPITQGQLLSGHLEVQLQFVVVYGQLVLSTCCQIQLLLKELL